MYYVIFFRQVLMNPLIKFIYKNLFIITVFLSSQSYSVPEPEVTIEWGTIKGFEEEVLGKKINTFLGIPFAEPPLGELRYAKSIPLRDKAKYTYRADKWPKACIEITSVSRLPDKVRSDLTIVRSEDCLYLNIWSPNVIEANSLKPVLIYIHGGAFMGFSSADSNLLNGKVLSALGDIVVVTFNYRLGALGFLYANDSRIPGNAGLFDQSLVLEWVHENIKYFGGDPSLVTLAGTSAGSISSSLHLLSPLSNRFFHRLILFSGTPISFNFSNQVIALQKTSLFASKLGCLEKNIEKMIHCLKNVPVYQINDATLNMIYYETDLAIPFLPVNSPEFFFNNLDNVIQTKSWPRYVPVLVSTVQDEGSIMNLLIKPPQKNDLQSYLTRIQSSDPKLGLQKDLIEDIIKLYFTPSENNEKIDLERGLIKYYGERYFECPSLIFGELLAQTNLVYSYKFTFNEAFTSPLSNLIESKYGVQHGTDIIYIFGLTFQKPEMFSEDGRKMSRELISNLANFIRKGKVKWLPFLKDSRENTIPFQFKMSLKKNNNYAIPNPSYFNCQYIRRLFQLN